MSITARTTLSDEMQEHFGLRRDPFTGDPRSTEEAFTNAKFDRLMLRLQDAAEYQQFVAVLAPVGAGKTTLKRRLDAYATANNGRLKLIYPRFADMSRVTASGIVGLILEEFDVKPRRSLMAAQRQLEQLLDDKAKRKIKVALVIDEAHAVTDGTLKAFKNFYELGRGFDRYLGLLLFGQPKLERRLEAATFREIAERLELLPLPRFADYAADYLAHRLRVAGGDIKQLFEPEAVNLLIAKAETPLALGNLANDALIKAANAGQKIVYAGMLEENKPRLARVANR